MSRGDPQIEVMCNGDNCGDSIVVGMMPLARNSWDERNVPGQIKRESWVTVGDQDYCPACAEERGLQA